MFKLLCIAGILIGSQCGINYVKALDDAMLDEFRLDRHFRDFFVTHYDPSSGIDIASQFIQRLETKLIDSVDPLERRELGRLIHRQLMSCIGEDDVQVATNAEKKVFRGAFLTVEALLPGQEDWGEEFQPAKTQRDLKHMAYFKTLGQGVNLAYSDPEGFKEFHKNYRSILDDGGEFIAEIEKKDKERLDYILSKPVKILDTGYYPAINEGVGDIKAPNGTYVPNLVVLHPYTYTFLYYGISIKFDPSIFANLPEKIQEVLQGVDPRDVEIFLSVQSLPANLVSELAYDMIADSMCLLLRPHYWTFRDWLSQHRDLSTFRGTKKSPVWFDTPVKAGLFGSGEQEQKVSLLSKDPLKREKKPYKRYPQIPLVLSEINTPELVDFQKSIILHSDNQGEKGTGEMLISTVVGGIVGVGSDQTKAIWSVVEKEESGIKKKKKKKQYSVVLHWLMSEIPEGEGKLSDADKIRKFVGLSNGKIQKDVLKGLLGLEFSNPSPVNELKAFLIPK